MHGEAGHTVAGFLNTGDNYGDGMDNTTLDPETVRDETGG